MIHTCMHMHTHIHMYVGYFRSMKNSKTASFVRWWWHMPFLLAFGRQSKQISELEDNLVYILSFSIARDT